MEISSTATQTQPRFALPVDSEHMVTEFCLFSVAAPHMRAFHLSWISFFACFVSTFAAPPLLPIIRDNLNLTTTDIGNSGIASVGEEKEGRGRKIEEGRQKGEEEEEESLRQFGLANIISRPTGGILSDTIANGFGMRGRLWALWTVQTLGGVFCIILGQVGSLSAAVPVMIVFSVFVQAACDCFCFRSLGLISGMTGGGGNVGAVLTQVIFFKGSNYSKETGITLMGVMIICYSLPLFLVYFPQWGEMFCGPSSDKNSEEKWYAPGKLEIC
ncbi:High-affinity nitrate transporter 2.1 [Hibiscus syriacus]|uniref:High-affinity nitrate transporter 2.1 n=1 Tax=Hibiscus syriacus TaxID=106335 RepID=A0A6A3ASL2_HIBSY|nr:High-affinity nitrate transporter 2.1 [Hibiscus syriacus]